MNCRYSFTQEEIDLLRHLIQQDNPNTQFNLRVHVLYLLATDAEMMLTPKEIAEECNTSLTTVFKINSELSEKGFHDTLYREKKHKHLFSEDEVQLIKSVLSVSKEGTRQFARANVLLNIHESNTHYLTTQEIAEKCKTSDTTVRNIRTKLSEQGVTAALYADKLSKPPRTPVTLGVEDSIITLASSDPPSGNKHWTIRLLAEECVKMGIIDSISSATLCRFLKKHDITLK